MSYAPDNTRGDDHPAWMDLRLDAACREYPTDMFYPEKGGPSIDAKKICRDCPVRQQCLDETMEYERDQPLRHGIAGGLSVNERLRLADAGWRPGDAAPPVSIRYEDRKAS